MPNGAPTAGRDEADQQTTEAVSHFAHMKWWGWGEEHVAFTHADKPALAPFVRAHLGVDLDAPPTARPSFEALDVPPGRAGAGLRARLEGIVGAAHVSDDALDRVVHTYGKSLRDLVRVRRGDLGRLPDLVLTPGSEAEVSEIVQLALEENAVVIPFGGGTNIAGSLEPPPEESRPVLSIDLGRMDRVLDVDAVSGLARVQAGVRGPSLEAQLNARGFTLGHFPDSFAHSTLGGWIATRSSGMQSDKYGDIADITRALRVVTPTGLLATRPVPSTSTGPSVREMVLGSEGRLGVITEATVHVHRVPEVRTILAYFFPTWSAALAAMRDIAASDATPSVTRVSDARETQFSLATKRAPTIVDRLQSTALKLYLRRRRGYDLAEMCLSFIGFEGAAAHVKSQRKAVGRLVSRHGGTCVGAGPGELYDQKKFDTPYIRDFLLDRGVYADVSETSAPWAGLGPLYDTVVADAQRAFAAIGVRGWIMCHLSHSYHAGACLYFTFAFTPSTANDGLAQYDAVKSAIQQAFVDNGATLSHHHGVGLEHARWLEQDLSPAGAAMIQVLVDGVDPGRNFNPGKIVR
ncbi:MAG TPA: FAD-binding oxidoreductase [Acidimicrobiales bacterium]|nr:FAD-binding oxidoreductase [Acidimicrobiales bacterium]